MANTEHISFNANDKSYLSILKKEIHKIALQAGFEQKRLNEIDIIVSELASNLVKHASGGEILAGVISNARGIALELIGIDSGPGIADPAKMLLDGSSTTMTLGQGLGSIKRFSDTFELYTKRGWGTILLSRIYKDPSKEKKKGEKILLRGLVVAKTGESVSGDGWQGITQKGVLKILIADGLGHGKEADHATKQAIKAFTECRETSPSEILRYIHQSIKRTRGCVATVVISDEANKLWTICGIGNISTKLSSFSDSKSYLPYNGIVGHNIPHTLNNQELSQNDYQQITLCSDGIKSRWEHSKHSFIQKYDLTVQAAALYKDYGRRTDDMSVIIGRVL